MSESLYRRNPTNNVFEIIKSRRGLLNGTQTIGGKSVQDRNPCFVTITGHNKSCGGGGSRTLPAERDTWESNYGNSFKPKPQLETVKLEYAGTWGLARRISASIRCFTVYDFEAIQKYFLLPGNEIDVTFGYKNSWANNSSTRLDGFKVATFSFNTTSEGFWICSFTAVSSSTAIENLEMQLVICNGCNALGGTGQSGDSGPLKYKTGIDNEINAVKGVAQLIASDAQGNGQTSIDDLQDGEVITNFVDYNPGSFDNSAAIVVYTGDHLRSMKERTMAWLGGIFGAGASNKSEVEVANNQVYVSLGYLINRIINDQLLRSFTCHVAHERDKFNKIKVEFHPIYSKCRVADGIISGDPIHVLMLGQANYLNVKNKGKDFDKDCKNLAVVKCNLGQGNIHLQNILLHRDVISAAYTAATQPRKSESDNTDVKDTQEQVVNIMHFFEKISDQISSCTGGAISLRLVENPDNHSTLIVVDQNYGVTETLKCIVFDPIDGDGNTRTCEVQSNVGSEEYKASMFVGTSKKGDAVSALRGCSPKLKAQRSNEHDKARTDRFSIIKNPGNLGTNYFNDTEINALKSVMGRLNKNDEKTVEHSTVHYPGLSMNITINGVWGIEPGNAISTTQVPVNWRKGLNSYFMVVKTTHTFSNSDWETSLEGILSYYNNIEYIPL